MRVLAIDTSNPVLTLAVVDEARVLGEWTSNLHKNHSVVLMDGISYLMEQVGLTPEQLDLIAVARGPGSYTGVRIGVATAKSMAWALGIPVVAVSSLQAVAAHAIGFSGKIVPLFDARRGQVYTSCYRTQDGQLVEEHPERIVLLADWLDMLAGSGAKERFLFLGEDVSLHRAAIEKVLGGRAQFAPPFSNHPRAAHIAYLGLQKAGEAQEAHHIVPEYLQLAEAEANWLAKQQT